MSPAKRPVVSPLSGSSQLRGLIDRTFQFALACGNQGNVAEAKQQYRATISLDRNHVGALHNLGQILMEEGEVVEGLKLVRRALLRDPGSADAHNTLGMGLQAEKHNQEAVAAYRKALLIRPNYPEAYNNLGAAFEAMAKPDEAILYYQRAVELRPDYATAWHKLGTVLEQVGRFDDARTAFKEALAIQPQRAEFHNSLAGNKRFSPGDPRLAPLEALAQRMALLPADEQVYLCYALGKAHADLGDHARSFQYYLSGNAIKRRQSPYDEAAALGFFRRVQDHFTSAVIEASKGHGASSSAPIFILGMPRSGSSLVEQVLASHPNVFGGGEMRLFGLGIAAMGGINGYPEIVKTLTHGQLRRLGSRYVDAVRAVAGPEPSRITDKMPLNFPFVGLIHLALPNATIIHTRRNPIDCCMSNFTNLFAQGHLLHTYDLAQLGRYYRAYEALMQHWRDMLPGVMLEVQYEDLIADFEPQARRIVAHCGLEWDDACLRFHETQRPVQTASVRQVRQPVYSSSVGRWRPVKDMLEPLLQELGIDA